MPSTTRAESASTRSSPTPITGSGTATGSPSTTDLGSNVRATRSSAQLLDGGAFQRSLRGLSPTQVQMLLGTMLGDGNMDCRNRNPKYVSRHGYCQHEYNTAKYRVLSAFASRPPEKVKNYGYGEWSSLWYTRTFPEFHPIASLCLHEGKKRVTQSWLDELTWEGIAWWYQDDGGLCGRMARFNTQGFPEAEVSLLASWLTRYGVEAKAAPIKSRRGEKCYWVVQLTTASTYLLAEKVHPWIVSSMLYKIDLEQRAEVLTCHWCGIDFSPRNHQAIYGGTKVRPCCGSEVCLRSRGRESAQKHYADPDNRAARNARKRTAYASDLEASRAKAREIAAAQRIINPQSYKDAKARYLAKKQAARAVRSWTCDRCKKVEPQGGRDSRTKYCEECKPIVVAENKARSAAKPRSSGSSGLANIP
jgi:hypothetical protein